MSYSAKSLTRLSQVPVGSSAGAAQANQSTHWDYATDDSAATVETSGYFNSGATLFSKGDIIDARMDIGGTPVRKGYVVTAASATAVTIALQTTTAG